MCNWCTNKITVYGDNIKNLLSKHFIKNEDDELEFDFNSIVKMPEDLEVERSSTSYDGFRLYLAKINPLIPNLGSKEDKLNLKDFSTFMVKNYGQNVVNQIDKYILKPSEVEDLKAKYKANFDDLLRIGEIVFNNRIKYGAHDWYDWRIKHWGCKWNSSNTYVNEDYSEIYFDSPWSPAIPVIEALAKLYPELRITHEFAEEQTGWYSGKYSYRDGVLIEALDYESYSKEAYELSFELWGNDESYKYNPDIDNYEYIENEGENI